MNALLTDAFLSASFELQAGPAGRHAGDSQGWRREMEKAQSTAWFRGPLQQGEGEPLSGMPWRAPAGRPEAEVGPLAGADPRARERITAPEARDQSCPRPAGESPPLAPKLHSPFSVAGKDVRSAVPHLVVAGGPQSDGSPEPFADLAPRDPSTWETAFPRDQLLRVAKGEAQAESSGPAPAPVRIPDAPGPRVHVEIGPEGLCVWLGLDGDEAAVAARSAALLAELRRAQAPGHRLASVVCNGRTVYASTIPKELP